MEELKLALKVNDKDNVATIFANGIVDGMTVEIRDKKGNSEMVQVIGDVPYGHKPAIRPVWRSSAAPMSWPSMTAATCAITDRSYHS